MKAVAYLAGYTVSMYFDSPSLAAVCFGLLFQSFFSKHAVRIENVPLRIVAITSLWPFRLIDYLFVCLRYAPATVLTARPYMLCWAMYIASIEGHFVPKE